MTYVPAKRGAEYVFYTALINRGDTGTFKVNPTLAVGDVTVSLGDGAKANIATLPVVTPAGSEWVKVTLSAAEMTSDIDKVLFNDVDGAEWCAQAHTIPTTARQIDDLAFPTVSGRSLDVTTTGEAGIDLDNASGTLAKGVKLTGFNDLSSADVGTALASYGVPTFAELDSRTDAIDAAIAASGATGTETQNIAVNQNG